jgi:hypothetical protein
MAVQFLPLLDRLLSNEPGGADFLNAISVYQSDYLQDAPLRLTSGVAC